MKIKNHLHFKASSTSFIFVDVNMNIIIEEVEIITAIGGRNSHTMDMEFH